jgi:hypothetical protein
MLRKESGQVLPMALILMLLGGLVVVPTLSLATTNLKATTAVDQHTHELYAADAGIEDALWYLQADERYDMINPTHLDSITYNLDDRQPGETVNERNVEVSISNAWLLEGISDVPGLPANIPSSEPGDPQSNPQNENDHWTVLGAISIDNTHDYILSISTDVSTTTYLDHIGIWLPPGFTYVNNSIKINDVPIGGPGTNYQYVKNPNPAVSFRGGNVYIWNYLGTAFKSLSDIAPPPSGSGVTPATKFPPSIMLSFEYTITPFREAQGFFPWIQLSTLGIAWDTEAGFYHVQSTASIAAATDNTTVEAYVPRGIRRWVAGDTGSSSAMRGDYIAIGNSLMTECWNYHRVSGHYVWDIGPPCNTECDQHCRDKYFTESSATINPDFGPSDAKIEKAYLYWTACINNSTPDTQATLKVNGTLVGTDGNVTADRYYVLPVTGSTGYYQYACFVDVTSRVKAVTTALRGTSFTLSGITATNATTCASSPLWLQATNAGWSMIIIYSTEDTAVPVHQIYLYDQLSYLWGSYGYSAEFTILGFEAPELNRDVKVGYFVAEGDKHITPDYFEFQGQNSFNYVYLGDHNTTDPNPYNNVYNSYSSSSGFTPSTLDGQAPGPISGVDMDVYTQDKDGNYLSSIMQGGDTQAKLRVRATGSGSGCDGIMLVYVVLSVTSTAQPVGEEFNVGSMMYSIK